MAAETDRCDGEPFHMKRQEPIMSEHPSVVDAPVDEPEGPAVFAPYDAPAGGWGALRATAHALRE
jgi:hypothetical protein